MSIGYINNSDLIKYGGDVRDMTLQNYRTSQYVSLANETKFDTNMQAIPEFQNHFFVNQDKLKIKSTLETEIQYSNDMKSINPEIIGLERYNENNKINLKRMAVTYLDMNYKRFINRENQNVLTNIRNFYPNNNALENVRGLYEQPAPILIPDADLGIMYSEQCLPLNIKMYFNLSDKVDGPLFDNYYNLQNQLQDIGLYFDEIIEPNINTLFCEFWNYRNDKTYFYQPNTESKFYKRKPHIFSLDGSPIKFKSYDLKNKTIIMSNNLGIKYKVFTKHYRDTNMFIVSVSLENITDYIDKSFIHQQDIRKNYLRTIHMQYYYRRNNEQFGDINLNENVTDFQLDNVLNLTNIFYDNKYDELYRKVLKIVLNKCIDIYELKTTNGDKYKVLNLQVKKYQLTELNIHKQFYTTSATIVSNPSGLRTSNYKKLVTLNNYPLMLNDDASTTILNLYYYEYDLRRNILNRNNNNHEENNIGNYELWRRGW